MVKRHLEYLFESGMTAAERRAQITAEIVKRTGIDGAMIARLVRASYAKLRQDALLGPASGHVVAGDTISVVKRRAEGWTLERVLHVLYRDALNAANLARLADLPYLAGSWCEFAHRRLERRVVEYWSHLLETPGELYHDPDTRRQ